jgi:hypothetical protein
VAQPAQPARVDERRRPERDQRRLVVAALAEALARQRHGHDQGRLERRAQLDQRGPQQHPQALAQIRPRRELEQPERIRDGATERERRAHRVEARGSCLRLVADQRLGAARAERAIVERHVTGTASGRKQQIQRGSQHADVIGGGRRKVAGTDRKSGIERRASSPQWF